MTLRAYFLFLFHPLVWRCHSLTGVALLVRSYLVGGPSDGGLGRQTPPPLRRLRRCSALVAHAHVGRPPAAAVVRVGRVRVRPFSSFLLLSGSRGNSGGGGGEKGGGEARVSATTAALSSASLCWIGSARRTTPAEAGRGCSSRPSSAAGLVADDLFVASGVPPLAMGAGGGCSGWPCRHGAVGLTSQQRRRRPPHPPHTLP